MFWIIFINFAFLFSIIMNIPGSKLNFNKFQHVLIGFLFCCLPLLSCAQAEVGTPLQKNLKKHVEYLASDALGGRLTGTKYELKAADYIKKQFKEIGLQPKGTDGYFQPFDFVKGYSYGKNNKFKLNNTSYALDKDFYPVPYSTDGKAKGQVVDLGFGITSATNKYDDYAQQKDLEGKIFLINLSLPDGVHPHSKYLDFKGWRSRYELAKPYKPAAIIFYNSENPLDLNAFKKFNNLQREEKILIHVTQDVVKALLENPQREAEIQVDLKRNQASGRNVIGFIDNGAAKTVVIGAHYDHLGKGEYENSLYRGKPEIHNGADDNASGTAVMIELARKIKMEGPKNNNYLFIAFSGEELGLLGSAHFTKNPTLPADQFNYMINMDMVGRLDEKTKQLGINGTGTSPAWDSVIFDTLHSGLSIKTSLSGMGPSDHSSFYLRNIPAIHFFSGTHTDYHKPTDDEQKLNYQGMAQITDFIYLIVKKLDAHPKLVFQKTKEEKNATPRFTVTLGIIPDYFYDKEGLRVDGVSEDKPAQKAGIKAGDIILKIGDYKVHDMNTYMEALSKLSKGLKTNVEVKRGEQILTLPIQF